MSTFAELADSYRQGGFAAGPTMSILPSWSMSIAAALYPRGSNLFAILDADVV
jgi:hypothetical protein